MKKRFSLALLFVAAGYSWGCDLGDLGSIDIGVGPRNGDGESSNDDNADAADNANGQDNGNRTGNNTEPGANGNPDTTAPGQDGTPGNPSPDGDNACDNTSRKTCQDLGKTCGQWSDGCGPIECGECTGTDVCTNGKCSAPGSERHDRVKNPFDGASFYINPEYVKRVNTSRAKAPSNLQPLIDKVKTIPTAVWLDRIATIQGTPEQMGVEGHLNEALSQQAKSASPSKPMLITFVIYDLPDRDCAAFASNGELSSKSDGLSRYKQEYIDAITKIMTKNQAYNKLRIVTIVEPDSIPNLITNLGVYEKCRQAESVYKEGFKYAISKLAQVNSVYMYLDIAHSGWLGWEHTQKAAQLYRDLLSTGGLLDKIRGFATNVANYSSLNEPFDPYVDVNKNRDLIEKFYEWNKVIDETRFVAQLREAFPDKGFIIDTSRNGWKARGEALPLDPRTHRGNWCNVDRAGLGERPKANPAPAIDAYFYIKPPGESDGTSDSGATTANSEGKSYDKMCGQQPVERPYAPGKSIPTDAKAKAPHAGKWFHDQFVMLVQNATPKL